MDVHIERGRRKTTRERESEHKNFLLQGLQCVFDQKLSHKSQRERDRQTDRQTERQTELER